MSLGELFKVRWIVMATRAHPTYRPRRVKMCGNRSSGREGRELGHGRSHAIVIQNGNAIYVGRIGDIIKG
jgi:hypothetical protein